MSGPFPSSEPPFVTDAAKLTDFFFEASLIISATEVALVALSVQELCCLVSFSAAS